MHKTQETLPGSGMTVWLKSSQENDDSERRKGFFHLFSSAHVCVVSESDSFAPNLRLTINEAHVQLKINMFDHILPEKYVMLRDLKKKKSLFRKEENVRRVSRGDEKEKET